MNLRTRLSTSLFGLDIDGPLRPLDARKGSSLFYHRHLVIILSLKPSPYWSHHCHHCHQVTIILLSLSTYYHRYLVIISSCHHIIFYRHLDFIIFYRHLFFIILSSSSYHCYHLHLFIVIIVITSSSSSSSSFFVAYFIAVPIHRSRSLENRRASSSSSTKRARLPTGPFGLYINWP